MSSNDFRPIFESSRLHQRITTSGRSFAPDASLRLAAVKKRGLALVPVERRIEIARKGGLSGRRHEFTPEEAREAGRKGGRANRRHGKSSKRP